MKEMQSDDFDPPAENQQIVRIVGTRGNNLHEVESSVPDDDEKFLVSMPTKFRKNVWVKRGDFVIVEPIDEGDKVKAEIVRILTPQHIKEFTRDGIWPAKFARSSIEAIPAEANNDSDNDDDLFKNTNRNQQMVDEDSDSDTESESDTESDADDEDEDWMNGWERLSEKIQLNDKYNANGERRTVWRRP